MPTTPLLSARGIVKVYPNGVVANDGVSLDVYPGEVLGLLGENGAGKTTLVRILAGELKPTRGEVLVEGRPARFRGPLDALRAGVVLVPQHPRLFDGLRVVEDIGLTLKLAGRRLSLQSLRSLVRRLAEEYGLDVDPDARVSGLSMGERQRAEIIRALALDAKVLLLDEPTTHLTVAEAESLVRLARKLASEGRGVVFITHKLREALEASDRIAVMRAGKLVGVLRAGEARPEDLMKLMFGEKVLSKPPARPAPPASAAGAAPEHGGPLLRVEDAWVRGRHGGWSVRGASLEVRPGEVVGIAGVAGNGQRELFEAIVGTLKPERGRVLIAGVDATRAPPIERIKLGMAVVPEERLGWGLVPGKSVTFNVALGHAFTRRGFLVDWAWLRSLAVEAIKLLRVKARSPEDPVDSLSGGNMQRLIVAREVLRRPRLLVAMNPTAGLDLEAAMEVRSVLVSVASRGAGVLVFSEDLDELLEVSDRILVMSRGRLHGPYAKPYNLEAIAAAMTG
ncbi:ABC transporter ATP-binding protein [Stetteria hydrogenophila]